MADLFKPFLQKCDPIQRAALVATFESVEQLFPRATRAIAWNMPTFKVGEDYLCHISGFKNHNSMFPAPASAAEIEQLEGAGFEVSKGTLRWAPDKPLPKAILKKILLNRLQVINDSYPKKNGVFMEYYKNGGVKASGKMKDGQPHGAWSFFRTDGSVMRTGSFAKGAQSGEWTTYAGDGRIVRVTKF